MHFGAEARGQPRARGIPAAPRSPGHTLCAGHPAAGSCEAARGGCQCAARGFSERLGGRREASPPLCVAPPAPPPPRAGALRGCAGLWGLWGLQEQEQEQEQRQEQEQPRSVRPRGGGAGVRGGQEGAGEGGAGPGGTHRELEVLGQQVLELGDALVDAVAPLLLDEPVGQLVGLLRGAVPGERSARPPRGARRAPGSGLRGGALCASLTPSPGSREPSGRGWGQPGGPPRLTLVSSLRFSPLLGLYTWYMCAKSSLHGRNESSQVTPGGRGWGVGEGRGLLSFAPLLSFSFSSSSPRARSPYPGTSPLSRAGSLPRQAGGGCALGMRSILRGAEPSRGKGEGWGGKGGG